MRNLLWASALASGLALAACGYDEAEYNEANADYSAEGNYDAAAGGAGYNAATGWPEGARIVEEDGVFYRVDTGGTRIRLEPGASTILVEDGSASASTRTARECASTRPARRSASARTPMSMSTPGSRPTAIRLLQSTNELPSIAEGLGNDPSAMS